MPGLSFSAARLFEEIKHFKPDFEVTYGPRDANVSRARSCDPVHALCHPRAVQPAVRNTNSASCVCQMDKFAKLWPDSLSAVESLRDLDYEADVTLPAMVAGVLNAHSGRRLSSKAAFRSIDTCSSGMINDYQLTKFVSKYIVRGRESLGYMARRQDMVTGIVSELMQAMDIDKDGVVSMDDFLVWSNANNLEAFVEEYYAQTVQRMEEELIELRRFTPVGTSFSAP